MNARHIADGCSRRAFLARSGGGFGLVGNIVLGIVGAVVAGWLLPRLGLYIGGGLLGDIINATIGALLIIFLLRLVAR